ncbi:calcium homeostasis modulator protein 6-like [Sorex fumeus]|uniref:calcium homeostasis modulator protein 6-like n=1 Tax=Sorex fumeus TaxID=62283 RepID=UPI0024AD5E6A|nr:calcium homeostasis modulator protein 6-like [Sorex fumeus]
MTGNQDQEQLVEQEVKKFQVVVDLYYKYRNSLGWGLMTVLTIGAESIFSNVVFKCPCNATWNTSYGMVFLLVPTLVLSILGFMMRGPNERLLDSCTKCCSSGFMDICLFCWSLTWTSLLWPLMWIAMALVEGTFTECASSGTVSTAESLCSKIFASSTKDYENCVNELPLVPCNKATVSEVQDLLKVLKAQSQVTGWILVLVIILIFLINAVVKYVCPTNTFKEEHFRYIYKQRENDIFQIQAIEHASKLAKENVQHFFNQQSENSSKMHLPNTEEWKTISSSQTSDKYYSPLHEYVEKHKNVSQTQS